MGVRIPLLPQKDFVQQQKLICNMKHAKSVQRALEKSGRSRFTWNEEIAGSNPACATVGIVKIS